MTSKQPAKSPAQQGSESRIRHSTNTKKSNVKKSKGNAQRAKKRAAARKVRKIKFLTLLDRYDQAVKTGKTQMAAKILASLKPEQVNQEVLATMRAVSGAQARAEKSVAKQQITLDALIATNIKVKNKAVSQKSRTEISVAEKKLGDAVAQLKKAQTAEQQFFADLIKKQTKNGICPFCAIERISVDSHVMDMHPPRWGEYLMILGKLK